MATQTGEGRIHPGWWTVILLATLAALCVLTGMMFSGTYRSFVPVTLTSDRAGLAMESGAKVKMRGVQVGRVSGIEGGSVPVVLKLDLFPDQVKFIPANVQAQIRATTAFGAKYVDLIYPNDPSTQRITAGAALRSNNVTTEVNTVFQNLVDVLRRVDPPKLNAILSALAEGVRGQGPRIGQATSDGDQVLGAINARTGAIGADWRSFKGFSDSYSTAAQDILTVLDAAATTSSTLTTHSSDVDALLLNVIGFARAGRDVIGPNKNNFVKAINLLEPTTSLLMKYNPEYTCMLVGAKWWLDHFGYASIGGDGRTVIVDDSLLLGADMYRYPDNLPIVAAKGGPGGKPGCGSLPDATKNFPVRELVTNTGWGTGLDIRPNPGIGHPWWVDYLPVTRATPQPPSVRGKGPPAIGPVPYPGAPPYGAPQYGPDGTPLYPGVPPAPPSSEPAPATPDPATIPPAP